jgi:hypothetical protein
MIFLNQKAQNKFNQKATRLETLVIRFRTSETPESESNGQYAALAGTSQHQRHHERFVCFSLWDGRVPKVRHSVTEHALNMFFFSNANSF